MDTTLIAFFAGCILWAALLFYVFVIRRASDLGAGGKSALVIVTALLLPVIGLALWNQSQSHQRLEALGFSICPGLDSSVGVTLPAAEHSTWLYQLSQPEDAVLDCYRNPDNHSGWKLARETPGSLQFERGSSRLSLQVSNGKAAFVLEPDSAQSP